VSRRLAAALLLLPLVAAGCSESVATVSCPGLPLATFAFEGKRTAVTCAGGEPTAGIDTLYPPTVSFTGTISSSASGATAALCVTRPWAEPLVGTWAAALLDVSLETRGALLSGCNDRCAVTVLQRVTGSLRRDPGGAPIAFTGALVDRATQDGAVAAADCQPCTTPCQASYELTGLLPP
jgi:hypothetical protein